MTQRQAARNIAQCIPRPLVGHELNDEGLVNLLVPRFRARWLNWLQSRLKKPYIKVKLDEIGSAAWLLIDGKNTIEKLGSALEEKFGEKIHPTGERLSLFLGMLKRNKFATWEDVEVQPAPKPGDSSPIKPR